MRREKLPGGIRVELPKEFVPVDPMICYSHLRDSPINLPPFSTTQSELNDRVPNDGSSLTRKPPISAKFVLPCTIDHKMTTFAKFIRKPLTDDPSDQAPTI